MSKPTDLRSSEEWQEEYKDIIEVYDPDGWDRKGNFEASWNEPIPEEEWWRRVSVSTCLFKDMDKVMEVARWNG